MNPNEREEEYNKIRRDYVRVVEESQEKIQIAEESYSLVDRYLRKLDQELHKFQLELEADNRGITEVLEKRSLELDNTGSSRSGGSLGSLMKENRAPKKLKTSNPGGPILGQAALGLSPLERSLGRGSVLASSLQSSLSGALVGAPPTLPSSVLAQAAGTSGTGGQSSYSLEQIGASSEAIAQAASKAIAATQLVAGRRSSSLKASYEAVSLGVATSEFSIGRELASAANSALAA